jgi:hypothetical protein
MHVTHAGTVARPSSPADEQGGPTEPHAAAKRRRCVSCGGKTQVQRTKAVDMSDKGGDRGPSNWLVSRVVSDFTVWFRDNEACLLPRPSSCVPVMDRG